MESPLHELAPADLRVIETLRYEASTPGTGFCLLARHLDRAAVTCRRLRIPFDRAACEAALKAAVAEDTATARCRLTIDRQGTVEAMATAMDPAPPDRPWRVLVSPERLHADDPWLKVKTTQRRLYDETRGALPPGVDEAIFLNTAGAVCEGTITNIFVRLRGQAPDAPLATPSLGCGLLPGILRAVLLESGAAVQRPLTLADLRNAEEIFVGNSLRGLIPAELI